MAGSLEENVFDAICQEGSLRKKVFYGVREENVNKEGTEILRSKQSVWPKHTTGE